MQALYDNQVSAIEKLRLYKVGALFMEPGTGKTRVAINLVNSIPDIDYLLWLTPFQTKKNLRNELEKCGCNADIIGIESLSNSDRIYLELIRKIEGSKKPFIILDESLKIKNWTAKRTRRIIELGRDVSYKLILNGTPLSRNLLDLWAQMEFLSPKILRMSLAEFKDSFCEYVKIKKHYGGRHLEKEYIKGYHNVDHLYKLIEPFVFECRLEIESNKQYLNIDYQLTEDEYQEHERIKAKYLDNEKMQFLNNNIFLKITSKLQHNYSLSPGKLEAVKNIISKGGRAIIFARFIETQNRLKELFEVPVMSWQKHSFGLNLQQFNTVIFFDKVWDYALRDQAEHRIYRIGQMEDCTFYDLTGNVGLEDMMNRNIERKGNLLKYFKNKSVEQLKKML
jgi:SNF2 family DNA or RNA helicase